MHAVRIITKSLLATTLVLACEGSSREQETTTNATQSRLVEPALHAGDPTCGELGYANAIADFPVDVGTFTSGTVEVTVTNMTSVFDWSANAGIDAVIVQGGTDANVYTYDPPARSDVGLHPPENIAQGQGKYYGFHRIQFCFHAAVSPPNEDAGSNEPPSTGEANGKTW